MGNNPDARQTSAIRPGPEWRAMQELPLRLGHHTTSSARDRWFLGEGLRFWIRSPGSALRQTGEKLLLLVHAHRDIADLEYTISATTTRGSCVCPVGTSRCCWRSPLPAWSSGGGAIRRKPFCGSSWQATAWGSCSSSSPRATAPRSCRYWRCSQRTGSSGSSRACAGATGAVSGSGDRGRRRLRLLDDRLLGVDRVDALEAE